MVTVWDRPSNTFTNIPKAELAPGMIQAKIDGRPGLVWVSAAGLIRSEYRQPPFKGKDREAIEAIRGAFPDVYDHDYDFWEDGFREDTNPRNEIGIWLVIAAIYGQFAKEEKSLAYRKEVFALLSTCSTSSRDTVFHVFRRETIPYETCKEIVAAYYDFWKPAE